MYVCYLPNVKLCYSLFPHLVRPIARLLPHWLKTWKTIHSDGIKQKKLDNHYLLIIYLQSN